MASARYFRFTKSGSTGPQTVSGVGFRPKALILWSTRQSAFGPSDSAQLLVGMTDGTDQMCRYIRHPDNEAATTSAQVERTNRLVYLVSATSGAAPTLQVEGQFQNFTSSGFVIDWLTNDGEATIFHAIAMGGSDLRIDYTPLKITVGAGGTLDVTTGFEPDCFIVIGGAADEFGTGDYSLGGPWGSIHGFGFSNVDTNVCGWTLGLGTAGAADNARGQHDDRVFSIRTANGAGYQELVSGSITAKSATGYTVTRGAAPFGLAHQPVEHILAIKGLQFALGSFETPASAGPYTLTLPIQPSLLLLQTDGLAVGANDGMSMAIGAWNSGLSGGSWIGGTDGSNPSVYARDDYDGLILQHRTPNATGSASAVNLAATVTSVSSTGAVLNFSAVPASPADVIYIAFAPTTPVPVDYEDPCAIEKPRLICKVTTETETFKISVHPLRESAAQGGFATPRMLDIGPITKTASDPSTGGWSAQTASLHNADTDRVLRAASDTRTSFRNAPSEIYLTSKAQSVAGGPPRVLFRGKVYSDSADANLVLGFELNDDIGATYSLVNDELLIPRRQISRTYSPNAADGVVDLGEPILGGRLAPLNPTANGEGIVPCITVGRITLNGTAGTPTGTTLAAVVAALQASVTGGTCYVDWGGKIGFADAQALQDLGTVPSDYDALASLIGYDDLNALLNEGAVTGGSEYVAVMVASHAIAEILTGLNSDPSVWIDDLQLDPAELGTQWWAPQISGDATWAADIGADLFTDILGTDGTTRRYTLILFAQGSTYGDLVEAGGTVHLDCIGMEDAGDGTGVPITDAFALYRHLLFNFILQDYQAGAWLASPQFLFSDGVTLIDVVDSASFDAASTVAALQTAGGRIGSFRIADRDSVRTVIPTANLSWGCRLAKDDFGRYFIKTLDFRRTQFLTNRSGTVNRTLRDKVDFVSSFTVEPKPEWQCNHLSSQYAMDYHRNRYERSAGGGGVAPLEYRAGQVRDGVLKKTLTMPFTRDDLTALHVAGNYRDLFANMPHLIHYTRRGLCGLEDDVLDGRPIRHYNGYGPNGYEDRAGWIQSKTFQKEMVCAFTALDVDPLLSAHESPPAEALYLDPVAVEALYDDVSGEPLTVG